MPLVTAVVLLHAGDDDDDLTGLKGALYKRKDFLDVEDDGTCVCAPSAPALHPLPSAREHCRRKLCACVTE